MVWLDFTIRNTFYNALSNFIVNSLLTDIGFEYFIKRVDFSLYIKRILYNFDPIINTITIMLFILNKSYP